MCCITPLSPPFASFFIMSFNRILPLPASLESSQARLPDLIRGPSRSVVFDANGRRSYNSDMVAQNQQDVVMGNEGEEVRSSTSLASLSSRREKKRHSSSSAEAMDVDQGAPTQSERIGNVVSADSNVSQQFATRRATAFSKSMGGWPKEASQVCLCQPEPKVPRPRNGMPSSMLHGSSFSPLNSQISR